MPDHFMLILEMASPWQQAFSRILKGQWGLLLNFFYLHLFYNLPIVCVCERREKENKEPEYSYLAPLFPHLFFLGSPSFIYRRCFICLSKWAGLSLYHCFIFHKEGFFFFPLTPCTAAAKSLQSCPTLCDPIDGSPPGSAVPGILQARTLEWTAISFSNA